MREESSSALIAIKTTLIMEAHPHPHIRSTTMLKKTLIAAATTLGLLVIADLAWNLVKRQSRV